MQLGGRKAFVSGSTQGVGRAMAMAIRDAGGIPVLHGLHDDEHATEAIRMCGPDTRIVFGDLAEELPECVQRVFDAAVSSVDSIDLLVCNAGTYIDQPFLEMDYATFDRTMKLNVYSQFLMVQSFARYWTENRMAGRVVITGSINGRLAEPTHVAYDTSKGAVESLVRSLAVTLAPMNIRVNGVAPGLFETPLTAPALSTGNLKQWMEWHTPNGRVPGPEAIGGATVFLLSDASEHMHGQMLFVDGGMSVWQQPDPPESPL